MIPSRWVIVSDVALDERNGAGMRAILPYLERFVTYVGSLYLYSPSYIRDFIRAGRYVHVPVLPVRGISVPLVMISGWLQLRKNFSKLDHYIIMPETLKSTLLGLICTAYSKNCSIWVMDDCVAYHVANKKIKLLGWIYDQIFGALYRRSKMRIVVSQTMADEYKQRYGVSADYVLGRSLFEILPPRARELEKKKIKICYVGSLLPYYHEPVAKLIEWFKTKPRELGVDLQIDLYGMWPAEPHWLCDGKVTYKGKLTEESLHATMQQYDYGLLPYSFNDGTVNMMKHSFPSKLIDYLGASLPVLTIAPKGLVFLDELERREIGPIVHDLGDEFWSVIQSLGQVSPEKYKKWQENAYSWANESFKVDLKKVRTLFTEEGQPV